MSRLTDWGWMFPVLIENDLPFLPGTEGEPWVSYQAAAFFIQYGAETLEKKARKLPKHPAFKGFIRLSDFERVYGGPDATDEKEKGPR